MADNEKYKHLKAVNHVMQFGLDMVTPLVLCVIVAASLKNAYNIGSWIVIVAIILGVACSALNMYKFIKTVSKDQGGKGNVK